MLLSVPNVVKITPLHVRTLLVPGQIQLECAVLKLTAFGTARANLAPNPARAMWLAHEI